MPEDRFIYDRTLREVLKGIPRNLVKLLTGAEGVELLDTAFPKAEERQADLLVRLGDGRLFHLEIQAQRDRGMLRRMLRYCSLIYEHYGQVPLQVLLWVGEGRWDDAREVQADGLSYRYRVVDIKDIDCRELLESNDPNDVILSVLCRRGEGFWERLWERLVEIPEKEREDYIRKLLFMVKLRREAVEELNRQIREAKMPIVIDKKNDPFYREGVEEGLVFDARDMVLEALEERFGRVSEDVVQRIKSIDSRDRLKALHRLAIRAGRMEEFLQALNGA